MNDPTFQQVADNIGERHRDALDALADRPDSGMTQQMAREVALHQLTDYWSDHVYEAAYDALSGFCGADEARALAGEIVARLREKVSDE